MLLTSCQDCVPPLQRHNPIEDLEMRDAAGSQTPGGLFVLRALGQEMRPCVCVCFSSVPNFGRGRKRGIQREAILGVHMISHVATNHVLVPYPFVQFKLLHPTMPPVLTLLRHPCLGSISNFATTRLNSCFTQCLVMSCASRKESFQSENGRRPVPKSPESDAWLEARETHTWVDVWVGAVRKKNRTTLQISAE